MYRSLCIAAILGIAGCEPTGGGSVGTEQLDEDSGLVTGDDELPVIEHEEFTAPQSASQNVTITATITDDDAIFLAQIHYRTQVSTYFFTTSLNPQSLTDYVGSIPSEDLGSGGMHYYIEAVDTSGNVAVLPEGAPSEYFKFDLVAR